MYLERSWKICPFCGESQRKDKKNEIKNPKVTNIKTESNKKILRWGKKIDKFIRSVGRVVNDFGRRSDSDKNLSESKSSKTQSKSKRK
jgi:hypothetical protein